jgi:hypothetical protein
MEWKIRLEARTGWGEATTYEVGVLRRDLGDLTSNSVGLGLAEAKALLAELQQRIVQTQIDEYIVCARVCSDCMKLRPLRDQRTRRRPRPKRLKREGKRGVFKSWGYPGGHTLDLLEKSSDIPWDRLCRLRLALAKLRREITVDR